MFKYLTAHHGIDWLCHYGADTGPDTTLVDNPARKTARTAARRAETALADASARSRSSSTPTCPLRRSTPRSPPPRRTSTTLDGGSRGPRRSQDDPRQDPRHQHDPNAKRAVLATQRRSLQMVLRLLAFNAEAWLADRLNAYLADNDEYRATVRHLLQLGGRITYTTTMICECRCGAPGWRTGRIGAGDSV
ncbi:MAG: hypothetical protein ACRDRK_06920 [Pseudonocardia sp.]